MAPPSIIQVRPLWLSRTWRSGSELPVAAFTVWGPDSGLRVRRVVGLLVRRPALQAAGRRLRMCGSGLLLPAAVLTAGRRLWHFPNAGTNRGSCGLCRRMSGGRSTGLPEA